MELHWIDWTIIIALLVISFSISFYFKKRSSQGLESFLLGGRKFPWYLAGISMVATTFAADTPLAVTELVAQGGISGNWIWWAGLIGGMFTTFFFAALWRKSGVLTEVELIEIRYSGRAASVLRGVKAVYLGLFMNIAVIAWVNKAMMTLIEVFFDVSASQMWIIIIGLMLFSAIYTSLGGLWGVAVTDAFQFVLAMIASIVLAVVVIDSPEIGGMDSLVSKLPEGSLNFLPEIGSESGSIGWTISMGAFLAFVGVQWWASWYPGAEPGGGGYVAQRMMSTRNEKESMLSSLIFQILHYCIRPWPWILVALAAVVLYPELMETAPRQGYVMAMKDFLPAGLKGLLLASFLAAYMSTISTQLNWGAGYLSNDLYKRFVKPEASDKRLVSVTRVFTLFLALLGCGLSMVIGSISGIWEFVLECGAGLGLVLVLRWYWWRINALSEIAATVAPFIAYTISKFYLEDYFGETFVQQKGTFFVTVLFTTVTWIIVTFITKPEKQEVLLAFYNKVKPMGWWAPIGENQLGKPMAINLLAWASGVLLTYSVLFGIGKFLFHEWSEGFICLGLFLISATTLRWTLKRIRL